MTTQALIAVFTILLTIALAAERLIEVGKPLIEKITPTWQPPVKITLAATVGTLLAGLFHFDLLKELTVTGIAPIVGYIAAGLVASSGSSVLHPILEWLKTLNNDTTTKVTKTTEEKGTTTIAETTSETSSSVPTPVVVVDKKITI